MAPLYRACWNHGGDGGGIAPPVVDRMKPSQIASMLGWDLHDSVRLVPFEEGPQRSKFDTPDRRARRAAKRAAEKAQRQPRKAV